MPEFSVVIPVYNKASHVAAMLRSVLAQDFLDFEILIVNDGSTDNSMKVIRNFNDPRIQIIDQKNGGLSQARNTGISAAKGQLIALLDADDRWKPDHLKNLYFLVKNFPQADLFGAGYEECFANGNVVVPQNNRLKSSKKPHIITDFFAANMQQPLVAPSSFAFRRSIIEEIGGFDTTITYSEDVDFYIRANIKYRFAYHPQITCSYTMQAENQITQSKKSDRSIPDFQKYLDNYPNNTSLRQYINLKRYFLAIFYKVENGPDLFHGMREKINVRLLTPKQRQLLNAPRYIVMCLRLIKSFLLKKGKRFTSF